MPAPVVLILAAGRGERFLASGGNTHKCIGWRQSPEVAPYRWPFEENGRTFDLAIEPQITTNDLRLMLRLALAGGGITIATQETFRPYIESGKLVSLLDDFLRHCCKVSDEAAFCLIQRPYISKTLLTRRISPRGSP